jgi:outer membrane cobalamin receptor
LRRSLDAAPCGTPARDDRRVASFFNEAKGQTVGSWWRYVSFCVMLVALILILAQSAQAQEQVAQATPPACCVLSGSVHASGGGALSGARISVTQNGASRDVRADADGRFSVQVAPGKVTIVADSQGFRSAEVGPINISADSTIDVALISADSPALRTIATVTINGGSAAVHQLIPSIDISRTSLDLLGFNRVVDGLAEVPSVTFARPDGGAATAPVPVALRGPDPSETLVLLDGQVLNDGNTGDLDVSHLPVAAFSNVEVTEGLGPTDSEGSNTIGGAVNLVSLHPTVQPRAAFSVSAGTLGQTDNWFRATGTDAKLGYAFVVDNAQDPGYVAQQVTICTGGLDTTMPPGSQCLDPQSQHIGATSSNRTLLANLMYGFSQRADIGLRVFFLGNFRDISGAENAPVDPREQGTGDQFVGPGQSIFGQNIRAYELHGVSPLGAGSLIYQTSLSDDSVTYTGSGASPYDVTHTDKRSNLALSWQRDGDNYQIALGAYARHESLAGDFIATTLTQDIRSYFVRGAFEPSSRVRLEGAAYLSNYSTFGSNVDGRFGASYDLGAGSAVHASVGTGFRAPLLIELYVFPLAALPIDANGVYLGQGNPLEQPEHATEYELGYSKRAANSQLDVSLYRTNLRDPIENFYPTALATSGKCFNATPPCIEFPINVGNVVYQGAEIGLTHRFSNVTAWARYGINIAYPLNLPETVSNPTSGGSLVNGQQFLNIPPQQGSFGANWAHASWHAALDGTYRGRNNELNAGPFVVVNAAVGRQLGNLDVTIAGTNLTNAVAGRFTVLGGGVPYAGVSGNIATDLFLVEPAGARVIFTVR